MLTPDQTEFCDKLQQLLREFNRQTRTVNGIYIDFDRWPELGHVGDVYVIDENQSPKYIGTTETARFNTDNPKLD